VTFRWSALVADPSTKYVRSMARILRTQLPDGVFHVTALGVDHTAVFRDGLDRSRFLSLLSDCVTRFEWDVYAYCLMTTHYHVVLETTVEALARGMHRLNGVHALEFNRRHKRWGHLFGDRYASWVVDSDEYLTAAIEYVLFNPVRAGLCARPEEWPWSGLHPRFGD
jgi:putative transposase